MAVLETGQRRLHHWSFRSHGSRIMISSTPAVPRAAL